MKGERDGREEGMGGHMAAGQAFIVLLRKRGGLCSLHGLDLIS